MGHRPREELDPRQERLDQEGEIEPKSEAAKRTIPLLAILRDFLDEQLARTGRTGTDRIFGCAADQVLYPSTVDGRAQRAWKAYNIAERRMNWRMGGFSAFNQ